MGKRRYASFRIGSIHTLVIHILNVLDGVYRPVVLIFRVILTILLIALDIVKDFVEVLIRVLHPSPQLHVKAQNVRPVQISIALIVNTNVFIKPHPCLRLCRFHLVQLLNHCAVERLSNRPSDCTKHLSDG